MPQLFATINHRLLSKAERLFSGSVEGRINELVQNARRAGATVITINTMNLQSTTEDAVRGRLTERIVFEDNGSGIENFPKLLDLGGSFWVDESYEASEDPAGAGLFSLAPRWVIIESRGQRVRVTEKVWHGEEGADIDRSDVRTGTRVTFDDDSWCDGLVIGAICFSGLTLILNGEEHLPQVFLSAFSLGDTRSNGTCFRRGEEPDPVESPDIVHLHDLGVRILAVPRSGSTEYIKINFHGQLVSAPHYTGSRDKDDLKFPGTLVKLHDRAGVGFKIEMTGEPTELRLKLPDRDRVVINEAWIQLMDELVLEGFRFISRDERPHTLSYAIFREASNAGIKIGESVPKWQQAFEGLMSEYGPYDFDSDPYHQVMTVRDAKSQENLALINDDTDSEDGDAPPGSVALALHLWGVDKEGKSTNLKTPTLPVSVSAEYDGYEWAKRVPVIKSTCLTCGDELAAAHYLGSGKVTFVKFIECDVEFTDGRRLSGRVTMHLADEGGDVLLTPAALSDSDLDNMLFALTHSYNEDGDSGSFDEQMSNFCKDFRDMVAGFRSPEEVLRCQVIDAVDEPLCQYNRDKTHPSAHEVRVHIEVGAITIITAFDEHEKVPGQSTQRELLVEMPSDDNPFARKDADQVSHSP